jgi:hypothetical protein
MSLFFSMGFEEWDRMTSAVVEGAQAFLQRRGDFAWWPFGPGRIADA